MSIHRNKKPIIGVCGGHAASPKYQSIAERVGKAIAREGWILICGGLTGVMYHACKGAKSEGGTTIGILPGISVSDANEYVDIPIATGIGFARNSIITTTADVVLVVDGEEGTLSEICYSIVYGKPVIFITMEDDVFLMGHIAINKEKTKKVIFTNDVTEAINLVKKHLELIANLGVHH
ncbi:MAG: TIGR00725 family protein [Promethearchaeota archaeon]